jgi:hypothetical protein
MPESIRIGHFTADKTDYNTSIAIRFSLLWADFALRAEGKVDGYRSAHTSPQVGVRTSYEWILFLTAF